MVAKSGMIVTPNTATSPGSGMDTMPFAPRVTGRASAVRRATSVRTRVIIAKYTPRSRRMGSPMSTLSNAQKAPAIGRVSQNDTPYCVTRIADTYPPARA